MFELMREMRWSWDQYEATPPYVRHLCWIFTMKSRQAHNDRLRRAQRAAEQPAGAMRVRR
jgi:hypothetical protein